MSRNLVQETSTSTGTANFDLAGATTGHFAFGARYSSGATVFYVARGKNGSGAYDGQVEVGVGNLNGSNQIVRLSVSDSSNSDDFVSFTSTSLVISDVASVAAVAKVARDEVQGDLDAITARDGVTAQGSNTVTTSLASSSKYRQHRDADGAVTWDADSYAAEVDVLQTITNTTGSPIAFSDVSGIAWGGDDAPPTTIAAGATLAIYLLSGGTTVGEVLVAEHGTVEP